MTREIAKAFWSISKRIILVNNIAGPPFNIKVIQIFAIIAMHRDHETKKHWMKLN